MAISGYPSITSVEPGGTIDFHLSDDSPGPRTLLVERIGIPANAVSQSITANVRTQPRPAINPWEGFGWSATTSFKVPPTWPTGLYRLADGGVDVFTFVVRPEQEQRGAKSKVVLHVSFLRPAAYNNAGDKSLYGFNSLPGRNEESRAFQVSLDRPGSSPRSDEGEGTLIRWLETEGVDIEYCSSVDLHTIPNLLAKYECLILAGHDEYWTKQMRDEAERFVGNGGNMIVLSGNTCYRAVRLERDNRLVVFHKYAGSDPNLNNDEATVAWAEPPLNRPQNSLLGVGFTEGAYGGPLPGTPYTIRFPRHWVFAGVQGGTTSPFMHYETDAACYVDDPEGYPRVTGAENTPLNFTVLAAADLRFWGGKPGRATMGIYSRNGTVFNAGTTDWMEVLGSDPAVKQITRNVFNRLKQRVPWDWEDIGHANQGCALASLQGKLFISTTDNKLWRRYPVGAEITWRQIGHANDVVAMAGIEDLLFCVTRDNSLWYRAPVEVDTEWTFAGKAPGTATKALAAAGGMLYTVDTLGTLWRTPAKRTVGSWSDMPFAIDPTINAMTSYSDILIASTADNRLLRSNRDFISESTAWTQIHHCDFSVGLAVVDWMLYVATKANRLWKLDLYGLRRP